MAIHTADAIVLRQYPYRETSVLVTCLTDRAGKIRGLVKGLRGSEPRYRSAMEPLSLNRIVFYDSRTSPLHLISQCDLTEAFRGLTTDLERLRLATFCAELVDAVLELEDPHPEVFALMGGVLGRLTALPITDCQTAQVHFVLRLLRLVGFQPQLDECAGCGQHPGAPWFWSARQGGALCERCLHQDPSAEALPVEWLDLLSRCAQADEPPSLASGQAAMIGRRLESFLQWRLERPLKTLRKTVVVR